MKIFFEKQGLTFANLSEKSLFAKIQAKNDFKKLKKKKKKFSKKKKIFKKKKKKKN